MDLDQMTTPQKFRRTTIADLRARKGSAQPLVCLTAYTAPMAQILDAHCDVLLVGDSIGMALYGMENTLGVTPEILIAHGKAVVRAAKRGCYAEQLIQHPVPIVSTYVLNGKPGTVDLTDHQ